MCFNTPPMRNPRSPGGQATRASRAITLGYDLIFYLSVMFLLREVHLPSVGFLGNGLLWSLTTLLIATWRMRVRGVTWAELGLRKPKGTMAAALATLAILGLAIGSILLFQVLQDQVWPKLAPDTSNGNAANKLGELEGNWLLFLAIMPMVLLESFLEEVLDRGFLMNWIERLLSSTRLATAAAVVLQAMIFGFRHSYDLSERSITVGLIGLAMGMGYVAFERNLWPLIIAHCVLNTVSMVDRVTG
jgi:hypothetical protein